MLTKIRLNKNKSKKWNYILLIFQLIGSEDHSFKPNGVYNMFEIDLIMYLGYISNLRTWYLAWV